MACIVIRTDILCVLSLRTQQNPGAWLAERERVGGTFRAGRFTVDRGPAVHGFLSLFQSLLHLAPHGRCDVLSPGLSWLMGGFVGLQALREAKARLSAESMAPRGATCSQPRGWKKPCCQVSPAFHDRRSLYVRSEAKFAPPSSRAELNPLPSTLNHPPSTMTTTTTEACQTWEMLEPVATD
ncbi:hypothetical protein LY76DRAFT_195002 [Colletotrichum caudatum]|nr:hypothetical protein LY76DRAFT_195002 [Colletotrichum caudatum]